MAERDLVKEEADLFRAVPAAFWLEVSLHAYMQRPVPFRLSGACIGCGETPCGWNCESYYNENGYSISSGEMLPID